LAARETQARPALPSLFLFCLDGRQKRAPSLFPLRGGGERRDLSFASRPNEDFLSSNGSPFLLFRRAIQIAFFCFSVGIGQREKPIAPCLLEGKKGEGEDFGRPARGDNCVETLWERK